jgi:hypothetical protein
LLAEPAQDNANNSSSSSRTMPNSTFDEAHCNNDMSRGSLLGPDVIYLCYLFFTINTSKKIQGKPHDTTQFVINNPIISIIFFDHLLPMPCNFFPFNCKWAALLVGLRMEVSDNWLPAVSGQALNTGRTAGVDRDIKTKYHFQLELDNEQGIYYAMRYDAVVHFAEEMHCSFSLFCLPFQLLRLRQLMMTMMMTKILCHPQHATGTKDAA